MRRVIILWILSLTVLVDVAWPQSEKRAENFDSSQSADDDGYAHIRTVRDVAQDDDAEAMADDDDDLDGLSARNRREFEFDPRTHPVNQQSEPEALELDGDEYADSNDTYTNCSSCAMRETRRQVRIEMIKKDLLRKLKLSHVPTFNASKPNLAVLPHILFDPPAGQGRQELVSEANFQTIIFSEERKILLLQLLYVFLLRYFCHYNLIYCFNHSA